MKTLKMLNTNLDKLRSLLWLQDRPDSFAQEFLLDKFFKSDNLQETKYVLEILESFHYNVALLQCLNFPESNMEYPLLLLRHTIFKCKQGSA